MLTKSKTLELITLDIDGDLFTQMHPTPTEYRAGTYGGGGSFDEILTLNLLAAGYPEHVAHYIVKNRPQRPWSTRQAKMVRLRPEIVEAANVAYGI